MEAHGGMARRTFLVRTAGAAAGLAAGLSVGQGARGSRADPWSVQGFDLLLRGGTLVDPGQGVHGVRDIGIREGTIAAVESSLDASEARQVIDLDGRIVTPGLIDMHVHVFEGVSHYGINADKYCLSRGVTTVVDTGSAGAQTFGGFKKYVINTQATRIRALLNISATGMLTNLRGELLDIEHAEVERAVQTIEENRDVIVGVKVRAGRGQSGTNDLVAVQRALQAATETGLPLTMHITSTVTPIEELLSLLRPGDVLTHSFRRSGTIEVADQGILTGDGLLRPAAREALDRGVLFDVGHGGGSFSFDVMEMAMRQEPALPSTISSDVHSYGIDGPVHDQATTVSKFLQMGLSLDEAIRRTTVVPAAWLGMSDSIGALGVGMEADIGIFELHSGEFDFHDSYGGVRVGQVKLVPCQTIKAGRVFMPEW